MVVKCKKNLKNWHSYLSTHSLAHEWILITEMEPKEGEEKVEAILHWSWQIFLLGEKTVRGISCGSNIPYICFDSLKAK